MKQLTAEVLWGGVVAIEKEFAPVIADPTGHGGMQSSNTQ